MYKQIVVLVHDVTYHAVYALLLLEELLLVVAQTIVDLPRQLGRQHAVHADARPDRLARSHAQVFLGAKNFIEVHAVILQTLYNLKGKFTCKKPHSFIH